MSISILDLGRLVFPFNLKHKTFQAKSSNSFHGRLNIFQLFSRSKHDKNAIKGFVVMINMK